ncbi:hypothetical protein [Oscillatoria sp. HE19RPO]|nr:hypothetical protein [Oscillatoria sp. HE19RPO]
MHSASKLAPGPRLKCQGFPKKAIAFYAMTKGWQVFKTPVPQGAIA